MQRISFDFMSRRIRAIAREAFSSKKRNRRPMTIQEVKKAQEQAEFNRQFIPQMRYGSLMTRAAKESDSRQVRRQIMRIAAFNDMTHRFPGERRRVRRSMAFAFIRNMKRKAA